VTRWLLALLMASVPIGACAGQAPGASVDALPAPCGDTTRAGERLDALRQAMFPETDDEVLILYGKELRQRMPALAADVPFAMVTDAATCARVAPAASRLRQLLRGPGVSVLRLGDYLAVVRWRPDDGWIHDPYAEILEAVDARAFDGVGRRGR
jgi:hypothetical protein